MQPQTKAKPNSIYRETQKAFLDELTGKLASLEKRVSIALVEPKYSGNIGSVARVMHNCGLNDLILINPCEIDDEALKFSMHSIQIVQKSRRFESLTQAARGFSTVAGTSSVQTFNGRKFRRIPLEPDEFWQSALKQKGKILLVFGREDDGLRNEEIEHCNAFIHITANPEYPVFNLAQSVGIILYEMVKQVVPLKKHSEKTSSLEINLVAEEFNKILEKSAYPSYKKKNAYVMIRRLVSRMELSETEYHKLMGIFKSILRVVEESASEPNGDGANNYLSFENMPAGKSRPRNETGDLKL